MRDQSLQTSSPDVQVDGTAQNKKVKTQKREFLQLFFSLKSRLYCVDRKIKGQAGKQLDPKKCINFSIAPIKLKITLACNEEIARLLLGSNKTAQDCETPFASIHFNPLLNHNNLNCTFLRSKTNSDSKFLKHKWQLNLGHPRQPCGTLPN